MPYDESVLLLGIADTISTVRNRDALFSAITSKLHETFPFELAVILTVDKERNMTQSFLRATMSEETLQTLVFDRAQATVILDDASSQMFSQGVMSLQRPLEGSPLNEFLQKSTTQTLDFASLLARYPDFAPFVMMEKLGIRQITAVPLQSSGSIIGILILASRDEQHYNLPVLERVAGQIAVAVDNAIAYDELRRRERETALQLGVMNALVSIKDRTTMFQTVAKEVNSLVPCEFFGIRILRSNGDISPNASFFRRGDGEFYESGEDFQRYKKLMFSADEIVKERIRLWASKLYSERKIYAGEEFRQLCDEYPLVGSINRIYGVDCTMYIPIWVRGESAATIILARKVAEKGVFTMRDLDTVAQIAPQVALALENFFAFEEIATLKCQLEEEKRYLEEEIKQTSNFEEIVGSAPALQAVARQVQQVAGVDATVLILGETGTGKELIARALHNGSARRERALIKLNCAALPANLIESELFGHERGAFTGATARRIGKFELANGGTIFLDEIGELPLELQSKLLRVLQEREFERVGGSEVLTTNVRIIAATHRNLLQEVADGRFRADLYFRLNVFTITMPPLRERKSDIPELAAYFADKYARKIGRPPRGITSSNMVRLLDYDWLGNVRELENVIERAVIVSNGATLDLSGFAGINTQAATATVLHTVPQKLLTDASARTLPTLEQAETAHILRALTLTGGRLSGERGAAALLAINAKTLQSRMKKLGIERKTVWEET
jgi:formate hydrogenlyase transcriptional activator